MRLQRAVDDFARRTGTKPELAGAGSAPVYLRGVPLDPTGAPFELTDGRVRLSKSSTLWPPPEEPSAGGAPTP